MLGIGVVGYGRDNEIKLPVSLTGFPEASAKSNRMVAMPTLAFSTVTWAMSPSPRTLPGTLGVSGGAGGASPLTLISALAVVSIPPTG